MTFPIQSGIDTLLLGAVGTLLSIGIARLISGQSTIRKEAKEGRKILHTKVDALVLSTTSIDGRVTTLESQHRINHPGQL